MKGGSASNVILNYGGSLEVYDGGFASNVILNPYSNVNVYAGGKIGDITVGGFAKLNVASGGIVTGTMNIKDGSSIKFANGAKVEFDLAVPLSEGAYINALS